MGHKLLAVLLVSLGMLLTSVSAGATGGGMIAAAPVLDPDGKIAGYSYGEDAYNHYLYWTGTMYWQMAFADHHIGVAPGPVAGAPFYLHAHVSVVAGSGPGGQVLVSLLQDAGGLPLRVAPTAAMPLRCSRAQFSTGQANYEIPCRGSVLAEGGHFVVTQLEPLVPGFQLDVEIPVVADSAGSGTAAMYAMWADEWYGLDNDNIMATVAVTVAPAPVPPATQPPVPNPPVPNPPVPNPPVVPAGPTVNPPAPTASVRVQAVSRGGKLAVDVDPDLGRGFWTFQLQRQKADGTWKALKTYKTRGAKETRKLNPKKGTYRVIVNPQPGYLGTQSAEVYLRR